MLNRRPATLEQSKRSSRARKAWRKRNRELIFQQLEERRVLAGFFDEVATKVDGALGSVTTGLRGVESLARLPLINKNIKEISQVTDSLESFRTQLRDTVSSLTPASAAGEIQNAIFAALNPLHVLADKVSPSSIGPEDVVVDVAGSEVAISLNVGKSVTFSSATGLGVDSVPFQPDAREQGSDGSFTVGLTYENLNFGYKNSSPYFSTSALNELQFKIYGYLPAEMTVGLGFLSLKAVDKTPEKTPEKADLSLTFSADITPDFTISSPQIGGGANLHLGLSSSFDAPGLPKFKTDFVFNWKLSDSSAPLSSGWGAPELAFNNVEMDIGSFLGNLVQPLAERAQDLLEPLQPIFDLITEPIPVIDDLSAAMDGPVIDLVFMSSALSAFPNMPQEFFNIIKAADRLRQFSQTVDRLAGRAGDHWVPLGNFSIGSPTGGSLLNAPLAALGNLGLSKWSSLIPIGGKLDLEGFKTAIVEALPGGVGEEINSLFTALTGEVAGNGLTLDFPIARDPSGVAMAFLLGQQEADLVTATANFNVAIDKLIDLSPIPGLIVGLRASGAFTAYAKMGYDIKGLQQAIAPLYAGRDFAASKILNGLWIDRNTRLRGDAKILVTGGVGLPDVVELTADGGLTTDLTISLSTNTSSQKIRPLAGELGSSLFAVNGTMDALAQVTFKAGFELLGEWIGIDKSWPFAKYNIYKFDTASVAVPPSMQPVPSTPPQLARYDAAQRVLTLNAGADAHLRGAQLGSAKDENFTIRRLPTGGLAVSAFGYVQKFAGPFDRVDALLDDGDDRLRVIDPSSNTFYFISAGDDDDVVNVDGRVKVYIDGGRGNDNLDGGSGRESIDIRTNGDNAVDNITLGDGLLQDIDPSVVISITSDPLDRLKIDNTSDSVGSKYYFKDDINSNEWKLSIDTPDPTGTIRRVFDFSRTKIDLRAGAGNDEFFGWLPQFTTIYAGGGNDTWDFTYQQPGMVPDLEYQMSFYGGPGNDSVTINDSLGSSNFKVRTNPFDDGPTSIIGWGNRARPTQVQVQGIEDTKITTNRNNGVEVDSWFDGLLTINTAVAQFNADNYVTGNTSIKVVNTPMLIFADPSSSSTQKGMGIDEFGPYLGNPLDYYQWPQNTPQQSVVAKLRIDYDEVTTSVDFFGSLMTIEPSVMYSMRPWNFRFVGSQDVGAFNTLKIAPPDPTNPNVASRDFEYRISKDTLTIGPMTVEASSLNAFQLIGGQGRDTIIVDSVRPGVIADINGGLGEDTLFVDDSFNQQFAFWHITPEELGFAGGLRVNYSAIENTVVRGGVFGPSLFLLWGDFKHSLRVEGGVLNDEFRIGQDDIFSASFDSPLQVYGGPGNDSFLWYGTNNANDVTAAGTIVHNVILDGGTGSNSLTIDDTRRFTSPTDYAIYPTRIRARQQGFGAWADFNYENMRTVTVESGNNRNTFDVHGISSSTSDAFWIVGNNSADEIRVYPENVDGSLALNGSLVVDGGLGTDRVLVDVSASSNDHQVVIQTDLIAAVSGFGPNVIGTDSDVEQIELRTGSGVDIVSLENFTYSAMALDISTGAGNDELKIVPNSQSIDDSLSSASTYRFDGGDGTDTFSLFNDKSTLPWFYTRASNALSVLSPGEYRLDTTPQSFESWTLTGGSKQDNFYLADQVSGGMTSIEGGSGLDSLFLGFNGYTRDIHGQVAFDGGIDGGMLSVLDPTNATGITVHIEGGNEGTIGGAPGDTLFGSGGSVLYRNLADDEFGDGFGLTLRLGSGADTIYTVPLPTATTSIDAGEPSEGSGDVLYLGLNQTQNPVVQNLGAGNGRVTSTNLKPIEWYSVEQVDSAYVAPNRFLVTNTRDSGPGSLRQALMNANATPNVVGPDQIHFAIPGFGAHTIQPLTQLPIITDTLVLDATTQPGYSGTPLIELNGSSAGNSYGLFLFSGGNTIRGLAINRFVGVVNAGILIQGPGDNVIQGNYLGTNLTGSAAFPNDSQADYGVAIFGSTNNLIGTDADGINDASERNVISGNREAGIYLNGDGNVVAGNFIGTTASGAGGIGNADGIVVNASSHNRIGGSMPGAGNVIAKNSQSGVVLTRGGSRNSIIGNSIFDNGHLGINLSSDNELGIHIVTPNDAGDSDDGVNNLQNFPEVSTVFATATQTIIGGQLQSTPNTQFRVEFFSSATKDPSGYGEGQSYLGYAMATTDSTGIASFVANFGTLVPVGQFISSTATDPLGNTSEFSLSREVVPSSSLSNVVALQLPTTNAVFLVASPVGTNLTASIKPNAEVPPPSGLNFPYGFLDFTVTGLVPGSAADVSISGLDLSQIRDYYKLGPTPGNNSMHWYSFMLGQGNPSDNPAGTGMEVVGGNMVLHLIDGKRGDDDLLANGTIVDIGGPVSQPTLVMASISGAAYLDITGNGLSPDDSPLAEVKVYLDTNNNGVWNTGEPTRMTLADGSYLFTGLAAGTYKVRQVTPTGYVRTAPTTVDYYSVVLATNQTSNLNRFAYAAKGNLSALSNVVYLVNGTTPVSDLSGSTTEGDTIQVSFTIRAGAPDQRLTLVSYTSPSSSFSSNTAYKQQIFDYDTNVFGPGTHTLTVSNPHSYYQVDFVSGHAIDKFGPAGSNIFYTTQNRLISADNGGTRSVLASPASLTGSVYRDANNNGTIDAGEQAIAGVKVTVSSGSTYRSVVTDVNGVYLFDNLSAGTYVITETQPNNYADGKETLGNKGGKVGSDKFTGIVLTAGAAGVGYNFGEQQTVGLPFADNQTQSASWWNSSQGQSLIKVLNGGPSAKNLGNWLASNFNNLFGAAAGSWSNLAGKTNSQVAAFYKSLYSNVSKKPEAEALALAFNIYVTNTGLAGTKAISFGFAVSTGGLGIATTNVAALGTALGVNHGTNITIAELLSRANALSRKGVLWDANCDRKINSAENILRSQVFSLMSRINNPLAEGEAEYQPSLDESNLAVNPSVNDSNHLDVNGDDSITSLDALLVINLLNRGFDEGSQIDSQAANSNPYFVDVNGDDRLSPLDALLIINYLNTREAGEGEASSKLSQADASDISTLASPLVDRAALQTGYDLNRIGKRDRCTGRLESLDLVFGEMETESLFDDTRHDRR